MDENELKQNDDAKPILYRLIKRSVLFFTLFLIVLFAFYIMGNYQDFLDENQKIILSISTIVAIFLVFFSLAGFIISIFFAVKAENKKRISFIVASFFSFLSFIFGIFCMIITRTINFLSQGIK